MKLSITIEGIPRVNQTINYTKKGIKYKPETEIENEKILRAGIISKLPYDFKAFTGAVNISKLHFAFPASNSLTQEEKIKITGGIHYEKVTKPDFTDCLKSLFKALSGTIFISDSQICQMSDIRKYYSSTPCIELEIEEISTICK